MQRRPPSALASAFTGLLAAYFAVSQPALCLCGLVGQPPFAHLHHSARSYNAADSAAHDEHPHTALLVLLRANTAATKLPVVEDAATLLRRLQSGLTFRFTPSHLMANGWYPLPEPPPPRA